MRNEPIVKLKCLKDANLDTIKGVDSSRQLDCGHGSRYQLRSVNVVMHSRVVKKAASKQYLLFYRHLSLRHYYIAGKP